jgi:uncharacterized membrane protein
MLPIFVGIPLLGFVNGARSMTPIAVVCWFAWLGRLHETGTWGFWSGSLISVAVFSVFALGEYVGDKLPKTPNRTDLFPLAGRIVFGGLVGALCATGLGRSFVVGAILGAVAAVLGTFATFQICPTCQWPLSKMPSPSQSACSCLS